MNIPAECVFLQDKNARSPDGRRTIVDDDSAKNTRDNFAGRYIIFREFIKAVV